MTKCPGPGDNAGERFEKLIDRLFWDEEGNEEDQEDDEEQEDD